MKNKIQLLFISALLYSCGQGNSSESISEPLDKSKFEIMETKHMANIENFYVYIKDKELSVDSLQNFANDFRREYCTKDCNVKLYNDNSIKTLVTKYPLANNEYIKVADHFVATSTFDSQELWLYPFQDIKYKELGGTNWKKDPIK